MATLDVRLLGPLEVRIDGESVAVPRGNTATVLAILLDEAGSVVPLGDLVRAVYGPDIPLDPDTQVQNTIGILRRKLGAARERLATVGRAYRFDVATDELDLLRCKAKDAEARRLRTEGDLAGAAAALRDALAEWRGPALADLSGAAVEAVRRRYDEHRLTLLERRIDLDLELGRHAEVVEELRQIVAVHDTRQRFTSLLMRALHASGRAAEALDAYEALRVRLADALGVDPDQALRDQHVRILRAAPADPGEGDRAPAAEPPRRVPATLPRGNTRFTGRDNETRLLDGYLDAADGEAGLAVITGMGGVGKTSLAVNWAHRVKHRFPDGQLYFNLRGFDPAAPGVEPGAVLAEALVALGVETQQLPVGLDERIGLYRTVLAQRKILVVFDNARDAAQVRPLLPVAPGSFTLVTSRDRLAALDATEGADTVPLELFSESEAWALLVRRIGLDRALADEAAVQRIIAACGRLPLALTLIGAWIAANRSLSLATLADRLERATSVFKVLASTDLASDPRSIFACSYQALGTLAAQAFRLFGLHPGPDLTVAAMASLMGAAPVDAEAALSELAGVHLIDQPREGRYTMHDLLRAYAKERFAEEVAPERRRAAEERMLDYLLHTTRAADELLTQHGGGLAFGDPAPGVTTEPVPDLRAAAAWFTTEYDVLLGLLRGGRGLDDTRTWRLAWCLAEYMMIRSLGRDLREAQTAALAAAERSGDGFGQAVALGYLSAALMLDGDHEGAAALLERATAHAEATDHPWALGFVHYGHSVRAGREERHEDACAAAETARLLFLEAGDPFWEFRAIWVVGWHAAQLGAIEEAYARFNEFHAAAKEAGSQLGIANGMLGFGFIAQLRGRFNDALECYADAERGFTAIGYLPSAALARERTGDARAALGDTAAARRDWLAAEAVYAEFGCVLELARVRTRLADPGTALSGPEEGLIVLSPGSAHERVEAALHKALNAFGYDVLEPASDETAR
ncbi:AfsR/SARP family transcriptional regulator [Glycomyces harbinensis]|uniref:DNA-binding transcriptional activator of the SARP family n=1 Tax=Glycomyces harbinensis TaxID=58114 RepID=A0A1G6YJ38_9ACTN|nr:AfsR/SARP family transcriptional regulator [Glycomyces harbinensis]SDD90360.1 DNA-binding transcriptional activator of the SARP family [Glycomyces harbinensis]